MQSLEFLVRKPGDCFDTAFVAGRCSFECNFRIYCDDGGHWCNSLRSEKQSRLAGTAESLPFERGSETGALIRSSATAEELAIPARTIYSNLEQVVRHSRAGKLWL